MNRFWTSGDGWSTEDELGFIASLGASKLPQRLTLLLGYQEGLAQRAVWADLNQATVREAADRAVKQETKRLADLRLYESKARVSVG